ncbi:MAG: hypothetical protein KIT84_40960 [Labilithrix sp.]|nr:hypothetical protein [Labilithrix sp.]MCW5817441.1 hypothetical protein [Labilithrix sp.]
MKALAAGLLTLGCGVAVVACAAPEEASTSLTAMDSTRAPVPEGELVAEDDTVACDACFPIESLPEATRRTADALLLRALDTEALYTLLSDIKPMSSGFAGLRFPAAETTVPALETLRAITQTFQCTPRLSGATQVFAATFDGMKSAEALLFHGPRFAATVTEHTSPFEALGIGASMQPIDAVDIVDRDPTTKRFQAYGHLFGYPQHAVDFFVAAAEGEDATGQFVERDFVHVPTFAKPTGAFTYAVPKGHQPIAADLALREKAAPVLNAYKHARAEHVQGSSGAARLLRALFDDGTGRCKPENAARFVQDHGTAPPPAPVCAGPGGHCSADADCCSGDCHGDHCH